MTAGERDEPADSELPGRNRKFPRFTIRCLMIAVAIMGLILGIGLSRRCLGWLSERFEILATADPLIAQLFQNYPVSGAASEIASGHPAGLIIVKSEEERLRGHAYPRNLAEKYEQAARNPRLPVAPDPPEPE